MLTSTTVAKSNHILSFKKAPSSRLVGHSRGKPQPHIQGDSSNLLAMKINACSCRNYSDVLCKCTRYLIGPYGSPDIQPFFEGLDASIPHSKTPAWSVRVLQFTHFLLEKGFCLIPKEQNKWSEGSDSYLSNLLTPWGWEASALFPHTKNTTCEHRSDSLLPCGMGCLWMRFRWNCWNSLPVVESYASIKLPPSGRKLSQHETLS